MFERGSKRGISTVVATVLIILITVAAVTILWLVILPLVRNVNFQENTASLSIETTRGYTAYDLQNSLLTVQVGRGIDSANISGVQFIFFINGNSYVELRKNIPDANQAITYNFNMSGFGKPDSISIAPVYFNGKIGEVVSTITRVPRGDLSLIGGDFPMLGNGSNSGTGGTSGNQNGTFGTGNNTSESCTYSNWVSGSCGNVSNGCGVGQRVQSRTVTSGTGCSETLANCTLDSSCNEVIPVTSYTIDSCREINSSGTYILNRSLNAVDSTGNCFIITADNVILNGNGFSINGTSGVGNGIYGNGVYAENRNNVTIKNFVNISNFGFGVYFLGVKKSVVNNVNANSNTRYGIVLSANSNNNTLTDITAYSDLSSAGVWIDSSSNNTLTNIIARSNPYGVYIDYGFNNVLTNINVSSNSNSGIMMTTSSNNTLKNITANFNSNNYGIFLYSNSNSNILTNITASSDYYGIYIDSSSNNMLTNINANENALTGILISPNYYYINANNNILSYITANGNTEYGIDIDSSSNNVLTNITANSNSYGGIILYSNLNNTLSGVTANFNVRQYYDDGSGITLSQSSNNTIKGITANSNNYGIRVVSYSVGNNFANNSVCSNQENDFHCYYPGLDNYISINNYTQTKCSSVLGCSGISCSPC